MDQLLTRYRAAPEADKRQLLGQVAVLGAYLKRGANLMFLAQQHRYVPSAELRYALEESISSLELAGVECAMEVTYGVRLPAEAAAAAVQEAPGSWVLNDHFEGGAPECGTN